MQQQTNTYKNFFSVLGLEIFARIWALWGIISFLITFLIVLLPSMISYLMEEKKGQSYFIKTSKVWMRIWLTLIGCTIKIKGTENFNPNEVYIVTCNHNALLDIPLSCPFIPGPNKTIAKDSFAKIPLFGLYYSRGSVLVNRKSDASRRKSFDAMKRVLQKGMHMSIYPEGTRNRTGQPLKSFYDGAFKLAVETKNSIIPAIILNTNKAMPIHKTFYLLPKKLEIHFLPPVSSVNISAKELKEEVFKIMWNYYTACNK
ncbi:MAG: 1-acyl-sn-glycerol-3-phosphate acyltransferase [Bacteroidetes bacterium]|nr:1-acyl-sn-glycerol-3-phosphate acyltransferase [Bacteroidota bacterium]MBS1649532.1 1-acyl-sn-glycerol-3-phosphate acyltransferase [Bacteroidota bacterium]